VKKPGDVCFILGDQLFPENSFAFMKGMKAFMKEDAGLCTHFRYHKQKLVFFLSAMRHFKPPLEVHYEYFSTTPYVLALVEWIKTQKAQRVHSFEVHDPFFETQLREAFNQEGLQWITYPSPGFLIPRDTCLHHLLRTKKPFMKTFYESLRKDLRILIDKNGKPEGGKWSFDAENRQVWRGTPPAPLFSPYPISPLTKNVMRLVEAHFPSHPGKVDDFWLPVTREGALAWLTHFIRHKLQHFGPFEDFIQTDEPLLFHSALSPLLNAGLLTPKEVLEQVLQAKVSLQSKEGFVRQILGWREFIRGIHAHFSEIQWKSNFFGATKRMKPCWWEGNTGLLPLDHVIKKVRTFGYTHHIERLMVASNIMTLCGIHPHDAHRWFMELFIDSADWVMGPNVFGMGLFSDGGIFATKPYICGSNYLLKMSNFPKGPWCETMDALYWNFIELHQNYFKTQPRLSMMSRMLERQGRDKRVQQRRLGAQFIQAVSI
jgi:deoxyribodipyrimidine photolyase-related protein